MDWDRGQFRMESGPAFTELQPRPVCRARAQGTGHRGYAYSPTHILGLSALCFTPVLTFGFVVIVDMNKIPQKEAWQGFLSLGRRRN